MDIFLIAICMRAARLTIQPYVANKYQVLNFVSISANISVKSCVLISLRRLCVDVHATSVSSANFP